MKNSNVNKKKSRIKPLCTYRDSALLQPDADFNCPADLAIRCAREIINETPPKLENQQEQLSKIIGEKLRKYYGKNIECFWSLHEKPSDKEMNRVKKENFFRKFDEKTVIKKAIGILNDRYHSLAFLEHLIRNGTGTGHVFDITCDPDGITLSAYSGPEVEVNKVNKQVRIKLNWPNDIYINQSYQTLVEEIKSCGRDEGNALNNAEKLIREYCDRFSSDEKFGVQIKERFGASSIDLARSAFSHFALILLYALNANHGRASYILSPPLSGETHSSMILFWPQSLELHGNSSFPHMLYLLHVILGLNAIRPKTILKLKDFMDLTIYHSLKNLKRRITNPIRRISELQFQNDESNRSKEIWLNDIKSHVNLAFLTFDLGYLRQAISNDNVSEDHENLNELYEALRDATQFADYKIVFENERDWDSKRYQIPKVMRFAFAKMIDNACFSSNLDKEIKLCVSINDDRSASFAIKSYEEMPEEYLKKNFTEDETDIIPDLHQGLPIARRIVSLCGGSKTWKCGTETNFKTVISFTLPPIIL